MPYVDHERVLLRLKEEIAGKTSHSGRDLLAAIGRLEVECQLPEGMEVFDARPMPRGMTTRPNGLPAEAHA